MPATLSAGRLPHFAKFLSDPTRPPSLPDLDVQNISRPRRIRAFFFFIGGSIFNAIYFIGRRAKEYPKQVFFVRAYDTTWHRGT